MPKHALKDIKTCDSIFLVSSLISNNQTTTVTNALAHIIDNARIKALEDKEPSNSASL